MPRRTSLLLCSLFLSSALEQCVTIALSHVAHSPFTHFRPTWNLAAWRNARATSRMSRIRGFERVYFVHAICINIHANVWLGLVSRYKEIIVKWYVAHEMRARGPCYYRETASFCRVTFCVDIISHVTTVSVHGCGCSEWSPRDTWLFTALPVSAAVTMTRAPHVSTRLISK